MHLHKKVPSLFRYCACDGTLDIVFPDWSFWGWILSTKFYISFPLRYKQKNHSFFFPLSFFRKDDYVIVYLKKIMYLSFPHKYILKSSENMHATINGVFPSLSVHCTKTIIVRNPWPVLFGFPKTRFSEVILRF